MKVSSFFYLLLFVSASSLAMENKDKQSLTQLMRKLSSPRFEKATRIETVHGVVVPEVSDQPLSPLTLTRKRSDSRSKFQVQEDDYTEVDSLVEQEERKLIDKTKLFLNLSFKKENL